MGKDRKHLKRWFALFLAVVVVAATCICAPDHFLRATDGGKEGMTDAAGPEIVEEELVLDGDAENPDEEDSEENAEDPEENSESGGEDPTETGSDENTEKLEEGAEEGETPPVEEASDEELSNVEKAADETDASEISEAADEEDASESNEAADEENASESDTPDHGNPSEDQEEPKEETPGQDGADVKNEAPKEDAAETEGKEEQAEETVLADDEKNENAGTEERPEQVLTAKAEDGARVTVSAPEGALPEGVTVTISVMDDDSILQKFEDAVEAEGKKLTGLKIYDITIRDADGNEIQPDERVSVRITNTGLDSEENASVYHAEDRDAEVEKVAEVEDANHADFEMEHFSPTAIATYENQAVANSDGAQETDTYVYVYIRLKQMDGSTDAENMNPELKAELEKLGLKINKSGWCTIGRVKLGNFPKADSQETMGTDEQLNRVKEVLYEKTELIDEDINREVLRQATDWSLHGANQADDYAEEKGITWHLDGTLDLDISNSGEEYPITCYGNGGVTETGETDYKATCLAGGRFDLTGLLNLFTKENAEFAGWKMSDDASGELIESSFVMPKHEVTLVAQWKELTVVKTVDRAEAGDGNPGIYAPGDMIEFSIKVSNTGDVGLENIRVADTLAGAVLKDGEGYEVNEDGTAAIASLAAGETVTVKAVFEATENEVGRSDFVNHARAEAGTLTAEDTTEPVLVENRAADFSVTKTIIDEKEEYAPGDVIHYTVSVTNTGNMKLNHIVVTDIFSIEGKQVSFDSDGMPAGVTIDGNRATIEELPAGASVTLNCSYTVTREDIISGLPISNSVMATGLAGTDGPVLGPKGDTTSEVKLPDVYNLTIHYVDANMTMLAPDVTAQYLAGETFSYLSPQIEGYTPNYAFVRTEAAGMPRADVEVSVIYTANPGPVPPVPPVPGVPAAPGGNTTPGGNTSPGGTATPGGNTSSGGTGTSGGGASSGSTAANGGAAIAPAPSGAQAPAPAGGTGTLPADGTAVAETETAAEEMPQGAAITMDEDGNVQIIPVTDPEVPLAGMNPEIDSHECCALHFILLLLSMVIFGFYTNDRKKLQKKILVLRGELEPEKQKRTH